MQPNTKLPTQSTQPTAITLPAIRTNKMTFLEEIQRRSESDSIEGIRQDVWENYGDLMFGSDVNTIEEMTNFQAAFLHLMDQKWAEMLYPLIQNNVKAEFDSWYEEEDSYEKISMQSIDLSQLESGTWQLMFEDDNMDLIVHLYMKQWEFDYTARTG